MDGRFFELDANVASLREREPRVPRALVDEFHRKLDVSWIYHDMALEGVVLQYSEIKAAIDKNIISDVSLIPSYQEVKLFKEAMEWSRDFAVSDKNKKKPIGGDTIRKLYSILAPEEVAKGIPFRKDNPLHRLYYHEIAQPAQIQPRMKKLEDWFLEESTKRMHVVDRAARAHFKLMSVYPWTKHTGRVARLLSNIILEREGYPLAIVHSIDRQRYYEVLRVEHAGIVPLYVETVATSIETTLKFYDEALATVAKKRAS